MAIFDTSLPRFEAVCVWLNEQPAFTASFPLFPLSTDIFLAEANMGTQAIKSSDISDL